MWPHRLDVSADAATALLLCAILAALVLPVRLRRFAWHSMANAFAFEAPRRLGRPWVVDGDTIDDLANNVRYRLANIDAPETGDNAKCFLERKRGQQAKTAGIALVRQASEVSVRRTWRIDRYGRRIAFVLVDGQDLGRILVRRGLARPWRGSRTLWCGKSGGLAKIAEAGLMPVACHACRRWR